MAKRRNPRTTPEPLFVVVGLPDHITLDRRLDHIAIRCGQCGSQVRHALPMTSSQLQRLADEFAGEHRHEPQPISDSTAKTRELAPCPFCGSKRLALVPWYELPNHSAVRCRDCLSQGPPAFPKEAAWEMWNRRAAGRV